MHDFQEKLMFVQIPWAGELWIVKALKDKKILFALSVNAIFSKVVTSSSFLKENGGRCVVRHFEKHPETVLTHFTAHLNEYEMSQQHHSRLLTQLISIVKITFDLTKSLTIFLFELVLMFALSIITSIHAIKLLIIVYFNFTTLPCSPKLALSSIQLRQKMFWVCAWSSWP